MQYLILRLNNTDGGEDDFPIVENDPKLVYEILVNNKDNILRDIYPQKFDTFTDARNYIVGSLAIKIEELKVLQRSYKKMKKCDVLTSKH